MRRHRPREVVEMTTHDLKNEAHMLIDEIRSYGVSKHRVYARIAGFTKLPIKEVHLRSAYTLERLQLILNALHHIRKWEERDHRRKTATNFKEERERMRIDKLKRAKQKNIENNRKQQEEARLRREAKGLPPKVTGKKLTKLQATLPLVDQRKAIQRMHEEKEFKEKHPFLSGIKKLYTGIMKKL